MLLEWLATLELSSVGGKQEVKSMSKLNTKSLRTSYHTSFIKHNINVHMHAKTKTFKHDTHLFG